MESDGVFLEGFIRPGCLHLTLNVLLVRAPAGAAKMSGRPGATDGTGRA